MNVQVIVLLLLCCVGFAPLHAQHLVRDINTEQLGSFFGAGVGLADRAIVAAGTSSQNHQLWVSDGTTAGTAHLPVLPEGTTVWQMLPFQDGVVVADNEQGIWITDGSAEGTTLVHALQPNKRIGSLVVHPGRMYFTVGWNAGLWVSDGASQGTTLVRDIVEGDRSSDPAPLLYIDGHVLFSADDGVHGRELWVTDGTEAGTYLLLDLNPGPGGVSFGEAAVYDDEVYLVIQEPQYGRELWRIDVRGLGVATEAVLPEQPMRLALSRPFPNPVQRMAQVSVVVPQPEQVNVSVFDILGRRVAQLYDGVLPGGAPQPIRFDTQPWPSGLYMIRAETASATHTVRVIVAR